MNLLLMAILLPAMSFVLMAGEPGWRPSPPLPAERSAHGMAMTHTGDVIVAGGLDAAGAALATAVVIRGGSGLVEPVLNTMSVPRARFALVAVALADGTSQLYAIGGYDGTAGAYTATDVVDVLTYDAGQDNWRWRRLGQLPAAAGDVRAVSDGAGGIVVSGGRRQTGGPLGSGTPLAVAARIVVASGVIQRLGDHITARSEHGLWHAIDQTGAHRVLAAGGEATLPTSTELLEAATWDGRANAPRVMRHFAVDASDPTGVARAFGGTNEGGTALAVCEWYDSKSGWRVAPSMQEARTRFDATFLASPTDTAYAWLAAAGEGAAGPLASCEIFTLPRSSDPTGTWLPFPPLATAAAERTVAMTSSNLPVVAGGVGTNRVEVFQPLRSSDVTFPDTEVGARSDSLRLTITNTWLLPVRIRSVRTDGAPDFLVAVDTTRLVLQPGQSRSVLVWFRPSQAGPRTSDVTIDMGIVQDRVTLRGNGLASSLQVVTDVVDFGDVRVGRDSLHCVPLLVNTGSDTARVDSITVDPADFVVVSPVGRVLVAPGDTLRVCLRFRPSVRGLRGGAVQLAVGARSFPASVRGNGITQLLALRTSRGCDTVDATVGDERSVTVTLDNGSDRTVDVSAITFPGAVAGRIRLADATVLPMTIPPGTSRTVDLVVSILREGEERYAIAVTSTSDTAVRGSVCLVVRSRRIQAGVGLVDLGRRCVGDVLERTITFTNVSATESLAVDSVTIDGVPGGTVVDGGPFTLAPRTSRTVTVRWTATTAGVIAGRVLVSTPNGGTTVAVVGDVSPGIVVTMPDAITTYGSVLSLPLTIDGVGTTTVSMVLRHATAVLRPRTVAGIAVVASTVIPTADGCRLRVELASVPADGRAEVAVDFDVLRGTDLVTTITPLRVNDTAGCVSGPVRSITVLGPCGGTGSLLATPRRAFVNAYPMPLPADGTLRLVNPTDDAVEVVIYAIDGRELERRILAAASADIVPLSSLPASSRLVQLRNAQGIHDTLLFSVVR